jgi:hypothetical protein
MAEAVQSQAPDPGGLLAEYEAARGGGAALSDRSELSRG